MKTPQLVAGPFTGPEVAAAEAAVKDKFAPVETEVASAGPDRQWLLLYWPRSVPDTETKTKILGFCHGAAYRPR